MMIVFGIIPFSQTICTNQVTTLLNMKGHRGKTGFVDSNLFQIVKGKKSHDRKVLVNQITIGSRFETVYGYPYIGLTVL